MASSLYIHVPFCIKKCSYCDFLSFSCSSAEHETYFSYLKKEFSLYEKEKFDTVYIGGGTPSSVSSSLIKDFIGSLRFGPDSEITIEVNPGTITQSKLLDYINSGINRISMGCQSFNDDILSLLGRIHNKDEIIASYNLIRETGFSNVNLDLIFSVPGQTMDILKNDLEQLVSMSPEHISIYSLIWEEDTDFYTKLKEGSMHISDESIEADMYRYIIDFLTAKGYIHYEISNFAKPGYESRHNTVYWENKQYLGIGIGASGYIGEIRYKNYDSFSKYYSSLEQGIFPHAEEEFIDMESLVEYDVLLGLRLLKKGINLDKFANFGKKYEDYVKITENLIEAGFLERLKTNIVLSEKGIPVANEIFMKYLK